MEKQSGSNKERTGSATTLSFPCPPELLEKINLWIAESPAPRPTREEAIRNILANALAGVGGASIPVEELNASNDE